MRKITAIMTLAALAASVYAGTAHARMTDEQCAEHVAQECGPIPFVQCFDDPNMWDAIDQDCTGYVQTNLENAREATEQGE